MVELFAAGLLSPRLRALSSARFSSSPKRSSPRRQPLNELLRVFHPSCPIGLESEPRWRISRKTAASPLRPSRLETRSLRASQVFPGRPLSARGHSSWDRTAGLLRTIGIALQSLPRTGQATLMASGSTGVSTAVDETAPLAWLVTRFTGSSHRTWVASRNQCFWS